ncbi:hypothetical protein AB0F52_23080 [Amycolatopsis sp. NPDC024027]|uniref:hypothetical protein n=1 Tax=Amycolatopsis sp. NPDC024027 TaxID=3154327 RepID=UPI00340BA38B
MSEEVPGYREIGDAEYALLGPDGSEWREVTGWLEPGEVRQLVDEGAVLVLDLCESWVWGAELDDEVLAHVVTAVRSHKLARGKYSGNVIYAPSLWRDRAERKLVLLAEENAKRKKVIRELRGDYEVVRGL